MTHNFLEPTQKSAIALLSRQINGPVVMLNLLRFRETADYSQHPTLAPDHPISGAEAFDQYVEATLPLLHKSGGELLFMGDGGAFFIGPETEQWDRIMLVRQSSVDSFIAFAQNETYQVDVIGHRTAALADSRLLPVIERA